MQQATCGDIFHIASEGQGRQLREHAASSVAIHALYELMRSNADGYLVQAIWADILLDMVVFLPCLRGSRTACFEA